MRSHQNTSQYSLGSIGHPRRSTSSRQAHPAFSHQPAYSQRSPAEQARNSSAAASWGADNQHGHQRVMHSSQPLRRVSSQGNPAPMFRHPAATQQQQQQQQQLQQQWVSQQAAAAVDAPLGRPETLRQRRRSRSQGDLPLLSLPLIPVRPQDSSRSPTALQPLQQVDADLAPQCNSFPEAPPAAAAEQQDRHHSPRCITSLGFGQQASSRSPPAAASAAATRGCQPSRCHARPSGGTASSTSCASACTVAAHGLSAVCPCCCAWGHALHWCQSIFGLL